MKRKTLIIDAAAAWLWISISGAAMAVNNCPNGFVTGVVEDDIVVDGASCVVRDADVSGDIQIAGAEDVTILSTKVSGIIRLQNNGVASVLASSARNIRVARNDVAMVVGNIAIRNLAVNLNAFAGVKQNGALVSITCAGNGQIDARFNNSEGEENCPARE